MWSFETNAKCQNAAFKGQRTKTSQYKVKLVYVCVCVCVCVCCGQPEKFHGGV
jgi:hypothetical protein